MILEQLKLRNFCLFRGTQIFNLRPVQTNGRHRPIVLFGGINGGGKTTLFDAIQLTLYGPRARCSKRANLSYEEFLRQSVHHGVATEEGAEVVLTFHHDAEGEAHKYEVRREWRVEAGKLRESLVVLQGGFVNHSLGRSWPQVSEELIPLEISQLFFFDGEKIRSLAEDATSSAALGSAIKSLLGLDIVERLIGDAAIVQARLLKQAGPPEQRAEAEMLERQFRELRAQLEVMNTDRAALENQLQRAAEEAQEAENAFAAVGGKHFKERDDYQKRRGELTSLGTGLQTQLLALAAGDLPLALVPDLLESVERQAKRERTAAEAEVVGRLFQKRDERLLAWLRELRVAEKVVAAVGRNLAEDREQRRATEPVEQRLALSDHALALLRQLRQQRLGELVADARRLLEQQEQVVQEAEDLDRLLKATPPETDLSALVNRVKETTQRLTRLADQARQLDDNKEAQRLLLRDAEAKLRRLWQERSEEQFKREDQVCMADLAGRTRDTMQEFLRQATDRKIDRLSGLITESFRFLARKQSLVEQIVIDPATFAVTVFDADGHPLPRQRLSEGEKQIFAVALLWGLARASARPLPAVIDTPMARLDAAHRQHLVERYFPNASHQVIVFSTDTEVDRSHYQALQPYIARAYHLNYDEQTRQTVGEEGYFWKETPDGVDRT
jgi:DNA sulfur modification protein DndD